MATESKDDVSQAEGSRGDIEHLVIIGCSAGAFDGLGELLGDLGSDFPCPVVVVLHLHPDFKSVMADILGRRTRLQVKQAANGPLEAGVIYVARPDYHVVFADRQLKLDQGIAIHFSRPSIDVTFESAAREYGAKTIAVLLSGAGHDGAAGVQAVKSAGGVTIAQLPESAQFRSMPDAAIATGCVDFILPLGKIGAALLQLCKSAL
jgi:two-component system, chemotaxis family, protein-glutamate methylesterase/glutaminase